ncbi:MAG: biopolymer transporter ExbD [Candidatus Omnitrophica bacterium]|nr:biopolymer transporter ExbD [Candidatus Omnitrophota bacterium]
MKGRTRKHLIAEINITPFTDVILVLLIVFMITTPLIIQSSIKVNLPVAASATPTKTERPVNIVITNEGAIYLDDDLITRKELKNRVLARYQENPNVGVVISSDRLVRFKDIVDVLDILNMVGIKNLNIAATTEK